MMDDVDISHKLYHGNSPKRRRIAAQFPTPRQFKRSRLTRPQHPQPPKSPSPKERRIKIIEPSFKETIKTPPHRSPKNIPVVKSILKNKVPVDYFFEKKPFVFDPKYPETVIDEDVKRKRKRKDIRRELIAPFIKARTLDELYRAMGPFYKTKELLWKDRQFWEDFSKTVGKTEDYDARRAFNTYRKGVEPIDLLNFLHPDLGFEYEPSNLTGRKTAGPYRRELIEMYKKYNITRRFENCLKIISNHPEATIFEQELSKYVLHNLARRRAYLEETNKNQIKKIRDDFFERAKLYDLVMAGVLRRRGSRMTDNLEDLNDLWHMWATPHDIEMRKKMIRRDRVSKPMTYMQCMRSIFDLYATPFHREVLRMIKKRKPRPAMSYEDCVREEFKHFQSPHDYKMIQKIRARPPRRAMSYEDCVREEFEAMASVWDDMKIEEIRNRPPHRAQSLVDCLREEFKAFGTPHDKKMLEKIRARPPRRAMSYEDCVREEFEAFETPYDTKMLELIRWRSPIKERPLEENVKIAFPIRANARDLGMVRMLRKKAEEEQAWDAKNMPEPSEQLDILNEFTRRATPQEVGMYNALKTREERKKKDAQIEQIVNEFYSRATPYDMKMLAKMSSKNPYGERHLRNLQKSYKKQGNPVLKSIVERIKKESLARESLERFPKKDNLDRYHREVYEDFHKRATPRDLAWMRKFKSRKRPRSAMDYLP